LDHAATDFSRYEKVDEIPFDFERRRVSVVMETPENGRLLLTKGAPEQLLPLCSRVEVGGKPEELTADLRQVCATVYEQYGAEGLRVLAIASRAVDHRATYSRYDERDLVLA